ncbi:hypothetical protein BT69DRAFT_1330575 [Atractiella rhizophila]|nr:hypothetical protein BT69DRAFT_1330575 [Atractiella rhizophila]
MVSKRLARQIKIVDMVKRNNEEGTAISKAEQKKCEREVNSDIPGYNAATIGHDQDYELSKISKQIPSTRHLTGSWWRGASPPCAEILRL